MRKIVYFLGLLFTIQFVNAQIGVTNQGILSISSPTYVVHIEGALTNNNLASLTNNGTLYVKGNIDNSQAGMVAGSGTLHLNGSSMQSINGGAVFKTNNLVTNNSAGFTLNNNLSIAGTHTFTAGIISSATNTNFLVYESGSLYTGQSDTRHVSGWVKKLGSTAFVFPVGNGTYLREIAISNITGSPEFNAHYNGTTTNTSNILSPLISIDPYEYWTLNEVSNAATAQVTLNWDKSKVNFPNWALIDIRSAQYTSGNWTNRGGNAIGSPATSGSITSTVLNSFGSMAIGSTSVILPLLFLDLQASRLNDHNELTWQTTNEEHVAKLEVQKSNNGSGFVTIGSVTPHNNKELQTYTYNDATNTTGVVYYRIRSVDIDGKLLYSKVVAVSAQSTSTLRLLNNPVKNNIVVLSTNTTRNIYHYQLITADGKSVQQGQLVYEGTGKLTIPLAPSATSGTYLLLLTDQKTNVFKVIVQ